MKKILLVIGLLFLSGCDDVVEIDIPDTFEVSFEGYTLVEVEGGDLSGDRLPNVVVDIGFGDREYYAYTNEYGQLIKVVAKEIILQDEENEPVTSTGRYYSDEAKVPGTESEFLDEGHVIADSLGGVANAYNITPQHRTLNRHGDQAYMEKNIRDAGGCTNFTAYITYPNNETQIPSHYSYTYTLQGNVIHDEFDNVDPDEVNDDIIDAANNSPVSILDLDKASEYIILINNTDETVNLAGWRILSVSGGQEFIFDNYPLSPGNEVKIGDSSSNQVDLHWMSGNGVWANTTNDPAELYNSSGELVDRFEN